MPVTALQSALNQIGRERGPDFILTIDPTVLIVPPPATTAVENVISNDSGISEVLNIIAFLVNPAATRVAGTIDPERSIKPDIDGTEHDAQFDVAAGNLTAANGGSLFVAVSVPLIDLTTFSVPASGAAQNQIIPQGILKRRGGNADPGFDFSVLCPASAARTLTGVAAGGAAVLDQHTTTLFSNCVKQMIHILIKVREIFGPQGWTLLFNQIKSGGAGKNNAAKRTHHHRRRYSSKQY